MGGRAGGGGDGRERTRKNAVHVPTASLENHIRRGLLIQTTTGPGFRGQESGKLLEITREIASGLSLGLHDLNLLQ